ncbi:amidohydrolase family protein [Nonlabens sp. MB-3u-79]|uniref:amidohydrolase family protein n=1 Tax=Nonlabens sp. MB-3u-79 TaxID=2058134 RepID=UPI001E3A2DAB|nr:amidohydrolase family protein [Nonlabens sp. MB-3u-79]
MKNILYIICALFAITATAQQTPASEQKGVYTIMNATAHIGNGKVIENSVIVIENGIITAIADATVVRMDIKGEKIDGYGMHVYPGIIAMNSTLGLVEVDAVNASDDEREIGTFNPHIRSLIAYNAESRVVESMRPNGVLIAQIVPRGGRISGKSSVVQLDAWNWEDASVRTDDGVHINWPSSFRRSGTWYEPGPIEPSKNYDEQVTELTDFLNSAKAYNSTVKPVGLNLKYAALQPALNGDENFYIHVDGEKAIRDVLKFIKANDIKKPVIIGGREGDKVATELVAMNIPVVAGRVHDLPAREDEDFDMPYKFPKLLADKGVMVALENSGSMERHQARNFPFYAGTVAGYGMDMEQALMMITLTPAKILGIDKNYGSLEQGKSATLFISKGNALDMRGNQLTRAFIDGRDISLNSHQTELYERYMNKFGAEIKR